MEIVQTTAARPPDPGPQPAKPRISSDFDTFLRMLTAQMRHQDPLNPIESADFATQLATFSGVEQAVISNDLLRSMAGQSGAAGLADMAGWVGKEVRAAAPAFFDGAPITLYPSPLAGAQSGEIVVRDANGVEVQRLAVPATADPLPWTGTGPDGQAQPHGIYEFTYVSLVDGQPTGASAVAHYGRVTELRAEGGQPQLIMTGGIAVAASDVTALREGS